MASAIAVTKLAETFSLGKKENLELIGILNEWCL